MPAGQVMPVPAGVDLVTASALPEVAATVWSNVFMIAGLQPGRRSWCTAVRVGSARWRSSSPTRWAPPCRPRQAQPDKLALCESLGADMTINYHEDDFVAVVRGGRRR